jgi:hypothetical protein
LRSLDNVRPSQPCRAARRELVDISRRVVKLMRSTDVLYAKRYVIERARWW